MTDPIFNGQITTDEYIRSLSDGSPEGFITLSTFARFLIHSFCQLNQDGQEKIIDYMEDMMKKPEYKRES